MPSLCRDCFAFDARDGRPPCRHCGSVRLFSHPQLEALWIAHVDCDAFYASVEKRDDPTLHDKPLLIGHDGGRGVVTTACYVARQYGCRSAMPMFKALRLCPDAVVKRPDMAKYKAASAEIRKLFGEITGLFEPVSIDEAYLDLSGANRRRVELPAVTLAWLALEVERRVGVTISIGLSCNKFLAKLASDFDKPRGFFAIGPEEARSVLAPLPVRKIHGVGAAVGAKMESAGWHTVADLQRVSERELAARFGRFGHRLAEFVQGEDRRPVTAVRQAKSISAETTFSADLQAFEPLRNALRAQCMRVANALRAKGLAGKTVTLKLKTSGFAVVTRRATQKTPTQRADAIFAIAERLLKTQTNGAAFRLIGVGVSDLYPAEAADPPTLFDRVDLDEPAQA